MNAFAEKVVGWYNINKRDLPWRNTKNPYFIWLSEIILQQTRVDQGLAYYHKFINAYPDIKKLAEASEMDVLKLWQGLGYYSRARNLHATAKIIAEKHNGIFPSNYEDILNLKGVGDYTAAAISSFAFNLPHAVVDGNVYRVLSRYSGIKTPINSSQGKKEFQDLANTLLDRKNPATYNQAIMEFGARQCKPKNPLCNECPLNSTCFAFAEKLVDDLPVKINKTKVRKRFFNYLLINYKNNLLITKRGGKDIWENLYDFPLIESDSLINEKDFIENGHLKNLIKSSAFKIGDVSSLYKHVLSHQVIHARFWKIDVKKTVDQSKFNNSISIKKSDLKNYPVPRLIEKYLEESEGLYK